MTARKDLTMSWEEICNQLNSKLFPGLHTDKLKRGKFTRWFKELSDKRNYFDPLTWKRAFFINQELRKDKDHFTVVIGYPGLGKSVLALLLSAVTSQNFRLANIAYNYLSFAKGLKERKRFDTFLLDEGALILHSSDKGDKTNHMEKLGTIMRQFNLHVIICIPDLLLLNRYFRTQRINTLIEIKARGKFRVYTGKAIKIIQHYYRMYEGDISKIKIPNGTFWDGNYSHIYPKVNDVNETAYKELKEKNADDFINVMYKHALDIERSGKSKYADGFKGG